MKAAAPNLGAFLLSNQNQSELKSRQEKMGSHAALTQAHTLTSQK